MLVVVWVVFLVDVTGVELGVEVDEVYPEVVEVVPFKLTGITSLLNIGSEAT
jgi:hypothetical protein